MIKFTCMFRDWLVAKYLEYRGDDISQKTSVTAFARWLGINQQAVDGYLKGDNIPTSKRIVDKLVGKYGLEVYTVLGMEISDKDKIFDEINKLPAEAYPELLKKISDLKEDYVLREISSDK